MKLAWLFTLLSPSITMTGTEVGGQRCLAGRGLSQFHKTITCKRRQQLRTLIILNATRSPTSPYPWAWETSQNRSLLMLTSLLWVGRTAYVLIKNPQNSKGFFQFKVLFIFTHELLNYTPTTLFCFCGSTFPLMVKTATLSPETQNILMSAWL